jgi:hypothetical protein
VAASREAVLENLGIGLNVQHLCIALHAHLLRHGAVTIDQTISAGVRDINNAYAVVEPTKPVPTIATLEIRVRISDLSLSVLSAIATSKRWTRLLRDYRGTLSVTRRNRACQISGIVSDTE